MAKATKKKPVVKKKGRRTITKDSVKGKEKGKEILKLVKDIIEDKQEGYCLVIKTTTKDKCSHGESVEMQGYEFGCEMTPEKRSEIIKNLVKSELPDALVDLLDEM